jgi:hypothetical protein
MSRSNRREDVLSRLLVAKRAQVGSNADSGVMPPAIPR